MNDDSKPEQTPVNDSATRSTADTGLTRDRSDNVLRFRVKVPRTLEQAAKLRTWLESLRHKTPRPAQNFLSNIVAQCKGLRDEDDLKRMQPQIAWQAERLAR